MDTRHGPGTAPAMRSMPPRCPAMPAMPAIRWMSPLIASIWLVRMVYYLCIASSRIASYGVVLYVQHRCRNKARKIDFRDGEKTARQGMIRVHLGKGDHSFDSIAPSSFIAVALSIPLSPLVFCVLCLPKPLSFLARSEIWVPSFLFFFFFFFTLTKKS